MSTPFTLGALDFSIVNDGMTAADALRDTLRLTEALEALGYGRYWLAEHHDPEVAHSSPEVLMAFLAARTRRIRIGAGGLLLRYYSPLKIAKNLRLLNALFPGRIELGVARGRAFGEEADRLLLDGRPAGSDFAQRTGELFRLLHGEGEAPVNPRDAAPPDAWMLGSGRQSMSLAALHGAAFCFSQFLPPPTDDPSVLQEYRERFMPGPGLAAPRCCIAVAGLCAPTERAAKELLARYDAPGGVVASVVGTPSQCREKLEALRQRFGTSDFIFHDICRRLDERLTSYSLLAEALALAPATPLAA